MLPESLRLREHFIFRPSSLDDEFTRASWAAREAFPEQAGLAGAEQDVAPELRVVRGRGFQAEVLAVSVEQDGSLREVAAQGEFPGAQLVLAWFQAGPEDELAEWVLGGLLDALLALPRVWLQAPRRALVVASFQDVLPDEAGSEQLGAQLPG